MPVDTAAAVILTREDQALALRQRPVYVLAFQGLSAGPDQFVFGQPGLGVNQASVFDYRPAGASEPVFARTGIAPRDVDTLHCYDGFSAQVLWTLERFGFCAPGEAADWVQGGRVEIGGELPVNTSGGHPRAPARVASWIAAVEAGVEDPAADRRDRGLKEVLESGGINVSPVEVEQLLASHPEVADPYVVGVPRSGARRARRRLRGRALAAHRVRAARVREGAGRVFQSAHHVIFRSKERLPRLASGKVARHRLREAALAELGGNR